MLRRFMRWCFTPVAYATGVNEIRGSLAEKHSEVIQRIEDIEHELDYTLEEKLGRVEAILEGLEARIAGIRKEFENERISGEGLPSGAPESAPK
jgi:hypothetical protein